MQRRSRNLRQGSAAFKYSRFCRLLRSVLGTTEGRIELSAIKEAATEDYSLDLLRVMNISQGIRS
jgi:hypothetical protein